MDNSYLNFIAYENQDFVPKVEIGLEDSPSFRSMQDDAPLDSPFSFENENQNMFFRARAGNLFHNIFDNNYPASVNYEKPRKHQPFQIIRSDRSERIEKKEETSTSDETSISIPVPDKIADKSRRIIKREKARQRNQVRNVASSPSLSASDIPQKYIPEGFNLAGVDDKSKKKMLQMIRNRISAQNSRDRKKAYIRKLEGHQKKIVNENLQLKMELRHLKNSHESLKAENEQLRKGLISSVSDAHDQIFQSGKILRSDMMEFDEKEDYESGNGFRTGVMRRHNASALVMKYSLALATLFAMLMFSNLNIQNTPGMHQSQPGKSWNSNFDESAYSHERKLEEVSVDSQSERDDDNDDDEIKLEIEEEAIPQPINHLALSQEYAGKDMKKLQEEFNEQYMSKFFNQLKVNETDEAGSETKFSQYLRKTSLEAPEMLQSEATDASVTKDNFTALFCPSGFEFTQSENNFPVKMEDGYFMNKDTKNSFKLRKAQWLQLFVPKSNLQLAKMTGQEELTIPHDSNCESEDKSLLELWCKVVNVRDLSSGF